MKTTSIISVIVVAVLLGAFSYVLPSQHTSAQMMNPNMMGRMIGFNGSFANPNMMFNGSSVNSMFLQAQNITGSINLKATMFNFIASQVKVTLSDAVATAQKQVGNNSQVVSAHLDVVNGYLTYTVCAIDPDMNINRLIIDAGNGQVLSSLKLPWQNMMMFSGIMGPGMMGPGMMGPGMMGFR